MATLQIQEMENAIDSELNRLEASSEYTYCADRLMIERHEEGFRMSNDDDDEIIITNPQGFIDALKLITKPINWQAETLAEDNSDEVFDAIWTAAQNNS